MANNFLMTEWSKDKKEVWARVVAKHGGQLEAFDWGTWDFFDWAVGKAWCTISSVSKARKFGWQRYDDTYDTYIEAFQSFENAGVLPRSDICQTAAELRKRSALLPHPREAVLSSTKGKLENGAHENGVKHNGVLNGFQSSDDLAAEV